MKEFVIPHMNKYGAGCTRLVGEIAKNNGMKRALIVTDKNMVELNVIASTVESLKNNSIEYVLYDGVTPNPTVEQVEEASNLFLKKQADFIIAIGGGSPSDCAKAVGILAANGGKIQDYEGFNQSTKPSAPLYIVNTTAGTASEISRAYLITDNKRQEKLIFKDINALPTYSFNDSNLMINLPASITAATGMDALTHALESYVSNGSYPLTDEFAKSAISLVFKYLEKVIEDPKNIEYRDQMIYAQTLGGMAFTNAGLGLVHAIAHPLGAIYNMPHGLANAIMLPPVMRFNIKDSNALKKYANLARIILHYEGDDDQEAALYLVNEVEALSNAIGTKRPLSEFDVKIEDLELLAEKALMDGNLPRNPVQPEKEDIIKILREVL